ncbi:MAG: hypothetical protein DRP93_00695 [Candidatus Neomarinimicrobiota bacterium]|nr:MAG: hypothetical protein DRP93_00695 [Candidatus Neomarinimicrobiota bacterium]
MKFIKFKEAILTPLEKIQNESGVEFLELMIDTIVLQDENKNEISVLNGWEYNLSRSRHWDKEQEFYIMYDGLNDEHLKKLYEGIIKEDENSIKHIIFTIEGMTDLDEPIHEQIVMEFNDINV